MGEKIQLIKYFHLHKKMPRQFTVAVLLILNPPPFINCFLFTFYLMSGVPSFFNGPATLPERTLYRLSGVPSFLSGVVVFVLVTVVGLVATE